MGPKIVVLDDLQELYVPVRFDHERHAAMAGMNGGCASCHHYTPPSFPHPACRECHSAAVKHEDLAQPGLKGAYHRQCLECHVEWDSQTKCEICHAKAKDGGLKGTATTVATSHYHQPMVMKDTILFQTSYQKGAQVPFHHKNHAQKYDGDCAMCHQKQSCATCHVHGTPTSEHPMGNLAQVDLHETCNQCHQGNKCAHCHGRKESDLFDHASTGWPMKAFHSGLHCSSCHGAVGRYGALDPSCASCHRDGFGPQFNHTVTGVVLDSVHKELDCADCHAAGLGSPSSCEACHDDGRKYTRHASFGTGKKTGGGGGARGTAGSPAPAPAKTAPSAPAPAAGGKRP